MWPFRRRATADSPAAPPVHRAGPGDWRQLPPIASVQMARLTTIDSRFEDHLATRRSPQFLRPLGHHLVPAGPSGRVAAAVVPGTRREFAPVATQRQVASLTTTSVTADPARRAYDVVPQETDDTGADLIDDRSPAFVEAPPDPVEAPTVGERIPAPPAMPVPSARAPSRPVERPSLVRAPEPPSLPSTVVPTVSRLADADGPAPAAPRPSADGATDSADATVEPRLDPTTADVDIPAGALPEVGLVGGEPPSPPAGAAADGPAPAPPISYTGLQSEPAVAPTSRSAGPESVATAAPSSLAPTAVPIQRSAHAAATSPMAPTAIPVEPTTGDVPDVAVPTEAASTVAGGPITTTPLDRPMRTVIGLPIVKVPAPAASTAASGGATVARELLTPSRSPSVPDADAPAPGAAAPVERLAADPAPAAPARRDGASVTQDGRPTLGREDGASAFEPDVEPIITGPTRPEPREFAVPAAPSTDHAVTFATPSQPDASASQIGLPVEGPIATRPTLTSEWLPAVARQTLDARRTARAPRPGQTVAPTVPHGDRPVETEVGSAEDGVAAPSSPDAGGSDAGGSALSRSGPTTFETTIATLGGQRGMGSPAVRAHPTTMPRTAIGPPVSRAAVQRSPLTTAPTGATAPVSAPTVWFDAPPAERGNSAGGSDVAEPITEWPTVQFELAAATAPPAGGGSDTAVMRAEATSGPAAPGASAPAGRSDAEVDELLRAMYPQLRRQLCRDLLLDRERAGYGTDIRF